MQLNTLCLLDIVQAKSIILPRPAASSKELSGQRCTLILNTQQTISACPFHNARPQPLARRLLSFVLSGESSNQTHTATRLDEHTYRPILFSPSRAPLFFENVFSFSCARARRFILRLCLVSAFSTQTRRVKNWGSFSDGCRTAARFPWTNFIMLVLSDEPASQHFALSAWYPERGLKKHSGGVLILMQPWGNHHSSAGGQFMQSRWHKRPN